MNYSFDEINMIFNQPTETFTVHVVEQNFAVNRGQVYFKHFRGTDSYIDSNIGIKHRIDKILKYIQKHSPDIAALIGMCFVQNHALGMVEVIKALSTLFTVHEHQAAGPEVIDPIIIQEEKISSKYLAQIVTLHKGSVLRPVIIIILKDNDFHRAERLLSLCPHGIDAKMIRNNGEIVLHKIINTGAENLDEFVEAYGQQCFSTCSLTSRNILFNEDWAENSIIKLFSPSLLRIRSNLLYDEKNAVRNDLSSLISKITQYKEDSSNDLNSKLLLNSFGCIARLSNVFCNDRGGSDITDAYSLAKEVDNELLLAYVYRYSAFFPNLNEREKIDLLNQAHSIFIKNNIYDHALYCENNKLIKQLYTDYVNIREFKALHDAAINNVPGLVGMPHIYNNVGVAYLLTGSAEDAAPYFEKGVQSARNMGRKVQEIAARSNLLIVETYQYKIIEPDQLRFTMNLLFDSMGLDQLPFISARYAMNILSIAFKQSPALGKEFLNTYKIENLVNAAITENKMGLGQLISQMMFLAKTYSDFDLLEKCIIPNQFTAPQGVRGKFIERYGLNPFFFSTWL